MLKLSRGERLRVPLRVQGMIVSHQQYVQFLGCLPHAGVGPLAHGDGTSYRAGLRQERGAAGGAFQIAFTDALGAFNEQMKRLSCLPISAAHDRVSECNLFPLLFREPRLFHDGICQETYLFDSEIGWSS